MKYLVVMLFSTLIFFSCSPTDESDDSSFQIDDFITIEGSVITDTTNAATINAWYTAAYLPKMMEYSGVEGAYLFQAINIIPIAISSSDFLSGNLAIFKSSNKDNLLGMPTSAQAAEANNLMTTKYPDGEIARSWSVSYEKTKSWENESADKPMQFVTMVPTVAAAGHEKEVDDWETNKHVPDQMKSQNLARVVRYKKIAGTGTGADGTTMPDYIELFYYADEASFKAHNRKDDPMFEAAEADREATWQNGELTFPWIFVGEIEEEVEK